MPKASFLSTLLIIVCFFLTILLIKSIPQTCDPNYMSVHSNHQLNQSSLSCYPIQNTVCLPNGFCACKTGYFGNCRQHGTYLSLQTMTIFNLTEKIQYFIIVPSLRQEHNEIAFKIMITTNQTQSNNKRNLINIHFWIDNDNLDEPTLFNSLDDQETSMKLKYGSNRYITDQYKFKRKRTGQHSQFIIGLSLPIKREFDQQQQLFDLSLSNTSASIQIGITYSQIEDRQDEQQQFLTVIIVIFALIILAVLLECFYFKKKHILKFNKKDQEKKFSEEQMQMKYVFIEKNQNKNQNQQQQIQKQKHLQNSAPPLQVNKRISKQQFRRQFLSQQVH